MVEILQKGDKWDLVSNYVWNLKGVRRGRRFHALELILSFVKSLTILTKGTKGEIKDFSALNDHTPGK